MTDPSAPLIPFDVCFPLFGIGEEEEKNKRKKRRMRGTHHNGGNQTFLKWASGNGRIEIIKYLLGLPAIEVNAVSIFLARNPFSSPGFQSVSECPSPILPLLLGEGLQELGKRWSSLLPVLQMTLLADHLGLNRRPFDLQRCLHWAEGGRRDIVLTKLGRFSL